MSPHVVYDTGFVFVFLSLTLCPVLVSPTHQTLPGGSGVPYQLSWWLSMHPMVSLRWIFSRLQTSYGTVCPSHTAQSLGSLWAPLSYTPGSLVMGLY